MASLMSIHHLFSKMNGCSRRLRNAPAFESLRAVKHSKLKIEAVQQQTLIRSCVSTAHSLAELKMFSIQMI